MWDLKLEIAFHKSNPIQKVDQETKRHNFCITVIKYYLCSFTHCYRELIIPIINSCPRWINICQNHDLKSLLCVIELYGTKLPCPCNQQYIA